MALAARDLTKSFVQNGRPSVALDRISLSAGDRERLVVLGPSGAGKTTLLRVIAGLERADGGSVTIDGRDVSRVPAEDRGVTIVFDRDGLFPHLTIAQNLAFGTSSAARIEDAAQRFGIADQLHKRPPALSAGERQRASLARALLRDPRVLLLDEPLSHLEPSLRAGIRRSFAEYSQSFGGAIVHVTHDHAEALSAGDTLAIMIAGAILQCGPPQRVYDFPATTAVARFFGTPPMNLLDGGMETIGVRAEHVHLDNGGALRGRVFAVEPTGADAFVHLGTSRGELVARVAAAAAPRVGEEVSATLAEPHVRRFDQNGALIA